jgi:ubiquinone/menaquinone biosynthesis C-methylase UbiE
MLKNLDDRMSHKNHKYVHGYSKRESQRLREQSDILEGLLHSDTYYPKGSKVLEVGCGVGAQTRILAKRSHTAEFFSIDISQKYLQQAKKIVLEEGLTNVRFERKDLLRTGYRDESFDHIFVCFVLEHLDDPISVLIEMKRLLKRGGSLTVIEGDHGSCFWYPETPDTIKVWHSLIKMQQKIGHDPLIGRKLYPLLSKAGFYVKYVEPRWVYTDSSDPIYANDILNKIITPMVWASKNQILDAGIVTKATWTKGLEELKKIGLKKEATFFYTWFKGVGIKNKM